MYVRFQRKARSKSDVEPRTQQVRENLSELQPGHDGDQLRAGSSSALLPGLSLDAAANPLRSAQGRPGLCDGLGD